MINWLRRFFVRKDKPSDEQYHSVEGYDTSLVESLASDALKILNTGNILKSYKENSDIFGVVYLKPGRLGPYFSRKDSQKAQALADALNTHHKICKRNDALAKKGLNANICVYEEPGCSFLTVSVRNK